MGKLDRGVPQEQTGKAAKGKDLDKIVCVMTVVGFHNLQLLYGQRVERRLRQRLVSLDVQVRRPLVGRHVWIFLVLRLARTQRSKGCSEVRGQRDNVPLPEGDEEGADLLPAHVGEVVLLLEHDLWPSEDRDGRDGAGGLY